MGEMVAIRKVGRYDGFTRVMLTELPEILEINL